MLAGRRFGGSNPFGIELFVLVSDPRFKNLGLIDQTPLALCWRQRNTPHDDRGCVPPDQAQGPRGLLLALTRCFLVQHLRRSNGATQTSSSDTRLLHRIARWSFLRCRVGSSNSPGNYVLRAFPAGRANRYYRVPVAPPLPCPVRGHAPHREPESW